MLCKQSFPEIFGQWGFETCSYLSSPRMACGMDDDDWLLFGMGALRLCHSSPVVLPSPGLFQDCLEIFSTSLVWGVSYTFWWWNGRWLPISDVCGDWVRNLRCFYLDLRPFGHFSALFSKGFAAKMVGWPTNWLWAFLWICDPWAVPSGEHVTTTVNHWLANFQSEPRLTFPMHLQLLLLKLEALEAVDTCQCHRHRTFLKACALKLREKSDLSEGLWFFKYYFPK